MPNVDQTPTDCDIVITGGGLAGAAMAYALRDLGLRIVIVEAQPFVTDTPASYDERAIALAYGSRRIFEGMGIWRAIAPRVAPIRDIHISDRGHFGVAHLHAADYAVDALGYVVTHRDLGRVLIERVRRCASIELWCPASVCAIDIGATVASVRLQDGRRLQARLVIAADGAQSPVRQWLGVDATQWQYDQAAIISTVTPDKPHANVAYERFTTFGPLALLPMTERRMSLVMTVAARDVAAVSALDDRAFLQLLYARFGGRLGYFTQAAPRRAFPLRMVHASEIARARLALIGNAAHTLHPIAGQGFNLGLRDIAALAEVIAAAVRAECDIGDPRRLDDYTRWRQGDHRRTIAFTDTLARVFANDFAPVAAARNAGLLSLRHLAWARHALSDAAMGLRGPLPRLARGLPI